MAWISLAGILLSITGYPGDDGDFENLHIKSIAEFIQLEATEAESSPKSPSFNGRMSVIDSKNLQSPTSLIVMEDRDGPSNTSWTAVRACSQAKEAGVAYIMGHSFIKASGASSFLRKLAIDVGYSFLRRNCRGPAVALYITPYQPNRSWHEILCLSSQALLSWAQNYLNRDT
ncbi:hypothetical protein RJ641_035008, partial [Dillenia turbinata]